MLGNCMDQQVSKWAESTPWEWFWEASGQTK